MKKISFLILCLLLLSGCNKINSNENTIYLDSNKISESEKDEYKELFKEIDILGKETVIELNKYEEFSLDIQKLVATKEDVDIEIENFLKEATFYEKILEGTIKEKETISINFEGFLNGKIVEGTCAENYIFTLGQNEFMDGFEDGLVGSSVGDTLINSVTFPINYGIDEVNGQTIEFHITVNYICGDKVKTQLTNEFLSEYTNFTSEEDMRKYLEELLNNYYEEDFKNYKDSYYLASLEEALLENNKIISLNEEEYLKYYKELESYYKQESLDYGYSFSTYCETFYGKSIDEFKKELVDLSLYSFKISSILTAIAEKEKYYLSDNEYEEKLTNYFIECGVTEYSELETLVLESMEDNDLRKQFLDEKIMELILETCKINIIE